jgi:Rgg/GadR/MutR family transcriptional activator
MINKLIGQTFRNLRISKNISTKEVTSKNFSQAQLSKFETGVSSITTEKLFDGLLAINVSWEEFSRAYYTNAGDSESLFPSMLNEAYHSGNTPLLKHMLEETNEAIEKFPEKKKFRLNLLAIHAIINILDSTHEVPENEIKFLFNYLTTIEIYTSYEYWIFAYCTNLLDTNEIIKIVNNIVSSNQANSSHIDFPSLRQKKYASILNSIDAFLERNELDPLPRWFAYLDKELDSDLFMYEKANFVYLHCVYDLKVNPQNSQAKEKLKEYFSALKLFKCFSKLNVTEKEIKDHFPDIRI